MTTLDLGNAHVAQIVDDVQVFALDHLLPSADRARIAAERAWLAPTWLTPAWLDGDDGLILSFHSFVVRIAHHTVLVDTCLGNDRNGRRGPPGIAGVGPTSRASRRPGCGRRTSISCCARISMPTMSAGTRVCTTDAGSRLFPARAT